MALPAAGRPQRMSLLMRVLGIYIAAGAGGIQLLDILVDRAGVPLSDRFFAMAIVIGVVGIPLVGAGAAIYEAAAGERAVPRRTSTPAAQGPAAATLQAPPQRAPTAPHAATPAPAAGPDRLASLQRRLELAVSYRRIAELQEDDPEAVRSSRAAWAREAAAVRDELTRLLDEEG